MRLASEADKYSSVPTTRPWPVPATFLKSLTVSIIFCALLDIFSANLSLSLLGGVCALSPNSVRYFVVNSGNFTLSRLFPPFDPVLFSSLLLANLLLLLWHYSGRKVPNFLYAQCTFLNQQCFAQLRSGQGYEAKL